MKKIDIRLRKLRREKAVGLSWEEDNLIELDPRQHPKDFLDTAIHEYLHLIFPDWDEKKVKVTANKLSKFLWKLKYRQVII